MFSLPGKVAIVTGPSSGIGATPRRTAADTEGEVQRILAKLEAQHQSLTVLRVIANSPALFGPFVRFTSAVLHKTTLSRPLIEAVILVLAADVSQGYELAEHQIMAAEAGLETAQVAALSVGKPDRADLNAEQDLAVSLARTLRAQGSIPRDLWSRAIDEWGTEGAVELLMVIGVYGGLIPLVLSGLELDASDLS